ncbi:MAG: hypothetical protein OEZ22_04750 [Spirochaetia bacterium]|nr:hypothetical protein [Spirochaetia bacterium]
MKKTISITIMVILAVIFLGVAVNSNVTAHENDEVYTCPMHPEVENKETGECPKCGMDLEKHSEVDHDHDDKKDKDDHKKHDDHNDHKTKKEKK